MNLKVFYGFLWFSGIVRIAAGQNQRFLKPSPHHIEPPRSPWLENAATRTARTRRVAKSSVVSQHVALLGKPFSRTHHVLGRETLSIWILGLIS